MKDDQEIENIQTPPNIGDRIKDWGEIIRAFGILLSGIGGFMVYGIPGGEYGTEHPHILAAILTGVLGCCIFWILGTCMMGFGELIKTNLQVSKSIRETNRMLKELLPAGNGTAEENGKGQ